MPKEPTLTTEQQVVVNRMRVVLGDSLKTDVSDAKLLEASGYTPPDFNKALYDSGYAVSNRELDIARHFYHKRNAP